VCASSITKVGVIDEKRILLIRTMQVHPYRRNIAIVRHISTAACSHTTQLVPISAGLGDRVGADVGT